jgi:Ca2+-binding RTX toxin-like protein
MVGGLGNDIYIVNSVNDSIYEQNNQGYDIVISSTSYLLNANIEELRLLEGFNIHGTGNASDNKIIGNSANNIIDGVTGADEMIGGLGDDTYYVDNINDSVVEYANQGTDTVQSSITYTLSDNIENLVLLDFSKAEKGQVDGEAVLVYGFPKRNELDYMQGDAIENYRGTCALTSIANLITQTGTPTSEGEVVNTAIANNWAVNDPSLPASQLGGSNYLQQQTILNNYGIANDVIQGYNETGIANLLRGGRGVMLSVNAGVLWNDSNYNGNGGVNHAITLTGAVHNANTGDLINTVGIGNICCFAESVNINKTRHVINLASS